uniref:Uncharacterized protein n=1 Tax=Rhizophora mucronata TaxID=61149 RepID=A0A2P2MZ86_RHIMU
MLNEANKFVGTLSSTFLASSKKSRNQNSKNHCFVKNRFQVEISSSMLNSVSFDLL